MNCKTILKSSTDEDYTASTSHRKGKVLVHIHPAEGTAGMWTYHLETLLGLDGYGSPPNDRLFVDWGQSWYVDNTIELLKEIINTN